MTPVSAVSAVAAFALLALCAAATAAAASVTPALSVVRRWGKQVEGFLAPEGDFRVFYAMESGQPIPAEKGQLLQRDGYVEWTFRDEKGNRYNSESTVVIPFGAGLAFNDTVTLKMEWLTVPSNDTWKSDAECKASKGGTVEVQENLRCPAGTGDFRVGLFDSGGGASALRGMANWKGWQVRFAPHLAALFADKPGRDDMSNASQWFRTPPSTRDGLLDDWCQSTKGYAPGSKPSNKCGWETGKISNYGNTKFAIGPAAPVGEWYNVEVGLQRGANNKWQPTFKVHTSVFSASSMGSFNFPAGAAPDKVDSVAITFPNTIRPYKSLCIRNVRLESGGSGSSGAFVGSD